MIIEIRRAGFINKGAELMLYAVIQKVKERYPEAKLVMAPSRSRGNQPFSKLAQLGFYPKAWLWRFAIQWGDLAALLPNKIRDMYGIVLDREVDVVLDAAGFAYSDQWGVNSSKELARSSKRWNRRGTKVVLLPQALGPYANNEAQNHVKQWVDNVDLVFAREIDSYKHLTDVVGEQDKIKIFPDFTNLVKGRLPAGYDPSDKRVAIVPNYRMIDKTSKEESEAYLPFMVMCARYLVEQQAKPFLLIHEGDNDLKLATQISQSVGGIPIVKETNPLHIKGILGTCDATIGSRFHGLVSALSQGVPSLATGWSHKYMRLFEDYDFSEGVLNVFDDPDQVHKKISLTLENGPSSLREKLLDRAIELKSLSEEMWLLVYKEIDEVYKKKVSC